MQDDLLRNLVWATERNIEQFERELALELTPTRRSLLKMLLKKELALISELRWAPVAGSSARAEFELRKTWLPGPDHRGVVTDRGAR